MKRFAWIWVFWAGLLGAQDLQLHYDFGTDRHYFTTTLAMFKPDEYGATFLFIDMNYDQPQGHRSASQAYMEISRYVNLPLKNCQATLQYNDGTAPWGPMGPIWLAGTRILFPGLPFSFSADFLYRFDPRASDGRDGQLTLVWNAPCLNHHLMLSGFMDLWSSKSSADTGRKAVLLSEPQFWFPLGSHLNLGSEVEVSHNLISSDWTINPTLAVKWNF